MAVASFEDLLLCSRHVVVCSFAAVSERGQVCALAQSPLEEDRLRQGGVPRHKLFEHVL